MKTVYPNARIPHLWAHQTQEHARGAGSIRFDGPVLYSYAEPIGYRIRADLFVLTNRTFSMTTSRHETQAWRAIPRGCTVIRTANVRNPLSSLPDELREAAAALCKPRILPATRAAHLRTVEQVREWIATLDAAHPLLSITPPADVTDRDALTAYDRALSAHEYVKQAREFASVASRIARGLRTSPSVNDLHRYDRNVSLAQEHAGKAGIVCPHIIGVPKTLRRAIAQAEQQRLLAEWAAVQAGARALTTNYFPLSQLERLLPQLADAPGHAEREAYTQTLRDEFKAYRDATLEQRAAMNAQRAQELFDAGRFRACAAIASPLRDAAIERFAEEDARTLDAWRQHERVSDILSTMPVALRLSRDGQHVETSHGAAVPVDAARMLWRAVLHAHQTGTEHVPSERHAVGHFPLGRIEANGDCVVGCHAIAFAESQRFAQSQGWPV